MTKKKYLLWEKEDYDYPESGDFIPNIMAYIEDSEDRRPALLIAPGGGYVLVSPTEGEIVAQKFVSLGYNAFVLSYTTNFTMTHPLKMQPLKDISRAVRMIRQQSDEFNIDPNQVFTCGFSAAGHLCASLAVHHGIGLLEDSGMGNYSNRPDGVILAYPVISSENYSHQGSFDALLGRNPKEDDLKFMSLEKQVNIETPPIFLWHTLTDDLVPYNNSLLFMQACKEKGIHVEGHFFGNGGHGLSLADASWASGNYGDDYTLDQVYEILWYQKGKNSLLEEYKSIQVIDEFNDFRVAARHILEGDSGSRQKDDGISIWPKLADAWIRKQRESGN